MKHRLLKNLAMAAFAVACAGVAADAAPAKADWAKSARADMFPQMKTPGYSSVRARKANPSRFEMELAGERFRGYTLEGSKLRADVAPDLQWENNHLYGFLEGPDGSTWYYTSENEYETVELPGGYATEKHLTGYSYTVYDSSFKTVGTLKDKITLDESKGETRLATLGIDFAVTRKFFNSDNNCEVMVMLYFNHADYTVGMRTKVYTLNGSTDSEGNTPAISEFEGHVVDACNMASDKWSEDFFVTVAQDVAPDVDEFTDYVDYLNAHYTHLTTYKKGGWSGSPQKVLEYDLYQTRMPGDQMNSPYFMSLKLGGKPTFVFTEYAKPFFDNPVADEPQQTPDNTLDIKMYQLPSVSGSEATLTSTTSVPAVKHTGDKLLCTFWNMGNMGYTDDLLTSSYGGTEAAPAFVVGAEDYAISEDDSYIHSAYIFGHDGSLKKTIIENADGFMSVNTPAGANREMIFITLDDFGYGFSVADMVSGEMVVTFPQVIDRETLMANVDRVSVGGEEYYIFEARGTETDSDENLYAKVAWVNKNGEVAKTDLINLGKDVAYASLNIDADVLNPYLFDTDPEMEYMAIVKRYTGNGTGTQEELVISGADSGIMFTALPDETLGKLANIMVVNPDGNAGLMIVYRGNDDTFTEQFYNLPLVKFAGGDGTAENPYQIATVGDLQQIKSAPKSHFLLVKNVDATGFPFESVEQFEGVLDGAGHSIDNLTFKTSGYTALFGYTEDVAEVKNLTFVNPTLSLNENVNYAATVACVARGTKFSNVHVHGLVINDEETSRADGPVGGLVAEITSYGTIEGCSVQGAEITLPEADAVGGIVGHTRTSAAISGSAFTGRIEAGSEVGGIVGSLDSGDEKVADCHADADITGKNTIGGIAGSSARATITRCHAEGTLTATTPNRWTNALNVGGVVGNLAVQYDDSKADEPVVTNNLVSISSITVPEVTAEPLYKGQLNTVHRIAGSTGMNREPEPTGYDDDWNPIYPEDAAGYEGGLSGNYAIDHLAVVDSETADTHNTTEGESIDRWSVDADFLGNLGFKFGADGENPWNPQTAYDPALHFESSIIINPSDIKAAAGSAFNLQIQINTRRHIDAEELMSDFMCDFDESHIEMTGNMSYEGNLLSIEFNCLREGTSQIRVSLLGSTAAATVTGVSGLDSVTVNTESVLSYDGATLSAEGEVISLYNAGGVLVARSADSLSTEGLAAGVYVAAAGESRLKIAVK